MFGNNKVMKQDLRDNYRLQVQEIFSTIQGEGPSAGRPAVFIRLVGCNLQCDFCDTDFESSTWEPTIPEILDTVKNVMTCPSIIVITGGEPFRQDISLLVRQLIHHCYEVEIETAGTLWIPEMDNIMRDARDTFAHVRIICSPKTPTVKARLEYWVHSYKYIVRSNAVFSEVDGLPMHESGKPLARPRVGHLSSNIYIQPCDEQDEIKNKQALNNAVECVTQHGYKLSLQLHKIVGLP